MERPKGFTLLELLITIAIAAILAAAAIPAFRDAVEQLRMSAYANALLDALGQARSEALRRGETVRVSAARAVSGEESFANGWCVHVGSACTDADGDNPVLGRHEALRGARAHADANTSLIEFDRFGSRRASAAALRIAIFPQRFTSCADALERARRIEILGSGRAVVTRPQVSAECPQ